MGKNAIDFGIFQIHWYGVIIAAAILAGLFVTIFECRQRRESILPAFDVVLYGVPVSMLMARLYYVMLNWQLYSHEPLEVLRFWNGGLDLYGAMTGMILTLAVYAQRQAVSFWQLADRIAPGIAIGVAVGLLGSFLNQEGFGYPANEAWGVYIDFANRPVGYEQYDYFQPIFMYESLGNLLLFLFLLVMSRLQKRTGLLPGSLFLLYTFLYAAALIYLEGLRPESVMIHGIRADQSADIAILLLSAALIVYRNKKIFSNKRLGGI